MTLTLTNIKLITEALFRNILYVYIVFGFTEVIRFEILNEIRDVKIICNDD